MPFKVWCHAFPTLTVCGSGWVEIFGDVRLKYIPACCLPHHCQRSCICPLCGALALCNRAECDTTRQSCCFISFSPSRSMCVHTHAPAAAATHCTLPRDRSCGPTGPKYWHKSSGLHSPRTPIFVASPSDAAAPWGHLPLCVPSDYRADLPPPNDRSRNDRKAVWHM